jgi:hypothetical protein
VPLRIPSVLSHRILPDRIFAKDGTDPAALKAVDLVAKLAGHFYLALVLEDVEYLIAAE